MYFTYFDLTTITMFMDLFVPTLYHVFFSGQYHCKVEDVKSENVTLSELQLSLPEVKKH